MYVRERWHGRRPLKVHQVNVLGTEGGMMVEKCSQSRDKPGEPICRESCILSIASVESKKLSTCYELKTIAYDCDVGGRRQVGGQLQSVDPQTDVTAGACSAFFFVSIAQPACHRPTRAFRVFDSSRWRWKTCAR